MPDIGLTHVALPVTDLVRSAAFYATFANMEVVHRRDGVVWLSDRTRPFVVVLAEVAVVDSPLRPFGHLGVGCATRAEVDRLCAAAREGGFLVDGATDSGPPAGYWAFLRDPDGHTLEVSFGQEVGLSAHAR
ncbi:MAG: VOC family protein [Planctomycetes bacterium]|nr:VOC family protein [Planctomycetota bacterium]